MNNERQIELYPLKFQPIFKYRIWGGNKLKTVLNKNYQEDSIGESWEISDIEECETEVVNGLLKGKTLKQLIKIFKEKFVGYNVYKHFGNDFPLLIKFIDAKTPLSIQVHPGNKLAKKRHNSFGKNEMWYVMEAKDNAELIVGFNQKVEKEVYIDHLKKGTLNKILNIETVNRGDTFYIPTGRVHAIGSGVLLAEIQQTSNITYRIYDYDRVDEITGKKRELHTDLAVDAIDFNFFKEYQTTYNSEINYSNKLVHAPYFKTDLMSIKGSLIKDYTNFDSFIIYMCVEGVANIECNSKIYNLKMGETLLIPANIKQLKIESEFAVLLEIYL